MKSIKLVHIACLTFNACLPINTLQMERIRVIETLSMAWRAIVLTIVLYPHIMVRLRGFEPRTNRLKVYCSTSWATGAYEAGYFIQLFTTWGSGSHQALLLASDSFSLSVLHRCCPSKKPRPGLKNHWGTMFTFIFRCHTDAVVSIVVSGRATPRLHRLPCRCRYEFCSASLFSR